VRPLCASTRNALRSCCDIKDPHAGRVFRATLAKEMKRGARQHARIEIKFELMPEIEAPLYSEADYRAAEMRWLDTLDDSHYAFDDRYRGAIVEACRDESLDAFDDPYRDWEGQQDWEVDYAFAYQDLGPNDIEELWRCRHETRMALAEYLRDQPDPVVSAWMSGELDAPDDGMWSDSHTLEYIKRRREARLSSDTNKD
jgi:hypothetical protein